MNKMIYFNLIDKVNKIDFTFDLTPDFFNEVRSWSKKLDLTQPDLVRMAYDRFNKKDYQKGMMVLGLYLLRSANWKLSKEFCNCFNYYLDKGNGYGFIRCLPSLTVSSHQEAHDHIKSWTESELKEYNSLFQTA